MNFREAFEAISEIAIKRDDSFCLEVEAWHHRSFTTGEAPSTSLVFRLYSCSDQRSYRAPTLEEVVRLYADGTDLGEKPIDGPSLDAVGAP